MSAVALGSPSPEPLRSSSGAQTALPLSCQDLSIRAAHHASVTSTNRLAWVDIDHGHGALDAPARWITADQQTAGKGRGGRTWATPRGNVAATLYINRTVARPGSRLALPLIAAISVYDAIAAACPAIAPGDLRLKWPNDVLLAGAKIAGILIETRAAHGQVNRLECVIGIGINVASPIDPAAAPGKQIAQLAQIDPSITAAHVRACLFMAMDHQLGLWTNFASNDPVPGDAAGSRTLQNQRHARATSRAPWQTKPTCAAQHESQHTVPAAIRTAYLARALAIGTPISVTSTDGPVRGLFAGITHDGSLRLHGPNGRERTFAFGEVNVLI